MSAADMTEYRVLVNGEPVRQGIPALNEDQALGVARAWKVSDNDVRIEQRRLNDDGPVSPMTAWRPFGS